MPVNISGNGSITGLTDLSEPTEINSGSNDLILKAHGAESLKCTSTENIFDKKINVDGDVQMASQNGGQLGGFRNKIINGACQLAQRSTSETGVTSSGYYSCDRWYASLTTLGTWTVSQSTESPDGFSNSFRVDCTTADTSPASSDFIYIGQKLEGQDLQDLQYGSPGAKAMTLSFWVRSNKTGAASFSALQIDSGRMYSTTYTINASDTWEYKTITIPGDTAGQIDNDANSSLQLEWWLDSGTNFSSGTTQGWGANVNANRNPSNLGLGDSTANDFFITGVQLEVGPVATPFEHRPYGTELSLCQRYYYPAWSPSFAYTTRVECGSATASAFFIPYPGQVPMRATPTLIGELRYYANRPGSSSAAVSGLSASLLDQGVMLLFTPINANTDVRIFREIPAFDAEL
jgi:hypothetical protein